MKTLIHIGYQKTGTTWLQKNFFPFINNICYLGKESELLKTILKPNIFDFHTDKIKSEFSKKYNKQLIISNEDLLGIINYSWHNGIIAKEIAQRLQLVFPKANIVIFIRNQFDFVASAYYEYIKSGGNYSFTRFFNELKSENYYGKIQLSSIDYLRYSDLIEFYIKLFGKDHVHVFLYEDLKKNNRVFLEQFSNKFDLKVDFDKIDYSSKNSRLRKNLVNLLKTANYFSKGNTSFKKNILNIPLIFPLINRNTEKLNYFKFFGKPRNNIDIIGFKNYNLIKKYYSESNQRLLKMGYESIKKYNYPL